MQQLNLKPTHKLIKSYYEPLGQFGQLGIDDEMAAGIVAKRFLGVPYATVSGHSRHVQQSCMLDGVQERQTAQSGRLEAEYGRH
jgi:hypothetical protein